MLFENLSDGFGPTDRRQETHEFHKEERVGGIIGPKRQSASRRVDLEAGPGICTVIPAEEIDPAHFAIDKGLTGSFEVVNENIGLTVLSMTLQSQQETQKTPDSS